MKRIYRAYNDKVIGMEKTKGLKTLVDKSFSKRILKKKVKSAGDISGPEVVICEGVRKATTKIKQ